MPVRTLAIMKTLFGLWPKNGPKSMRIAADFANAAIEFDATEQQMSNVFGTAQAIYIDNSANAGVCKVTPAGADMPIYCPSNSVGMFPFNSSGKLRATFTHTLAECHVDAWLFNMPQPYFVHPVL